MSGDSVPRVPLRVSQGTVVASVQVDFEPAVLAQFRHDLLGAVQRSQATGVIIDLSALGVLDPGDLADLRDTMNMASLLGARSVLAGMRPGMVSALVDLDADVDGLNGVLTLDDAFEKLDELRDVDAGDSWDSDR